MLFRPLLKSVFAAAFIQIFFIGNTSAEPRPNVVILFIDDLGFGDIGCFGNERTPTPHIDSLAERGAKCTMSYITNPPCCPSQFR